VTAWRSAVVCNIQVEHQNQSEAEKRDFLQRIADREEALHQANVSSDLRLVPVISYWKPVARTVFQLFLGWPSSIWYPL